MTASPRRLLAYYVVLGAALAVVATLVFAAGRDQTAAPEIAGGYDVAAGAGCLGRQITLRQSGQFVALARPNGDGAGKLRFRHGRLTGDASCLAGGSRRVDATVRGGVLAGALGGAELRASFRRDAAAPGAQPARPPGSIAGSYRLLPRSDCLGGTIELAGSGDALTVDAGGRDAGRLRYDEGDVQGAVACRGGGRAALAGTAAGRELTLTLRGPGGGERLAAQKRRDFGEGLAAFFLAVAAVMLLARLAGAAIVKVGQPRVMGEVAAGIVLGPTVFGALLPGAQNALFPVDIIPYIGVAANLGLIFYMFLVGLEIDFAQLKGRITQTAVISNTGIAIPMLAGIAVAVPTYRLVGPDTKFSAFALFMGVSMSITAFPVLARILVERRMLKQPLGVLALASAAIDDVSAWFLIALASAVAVAGSGSAVLRTILLAAAFCLFMGLVVRRVIARVSIAFDEVGRLPGAWTTAILAGVLLSAYATEEIGIALIFGAFVMGTIMPRHAGLTEDVTRRLEDFVVLLLLPLFFAFTGLRTNALALDRSALVLLTVALIVVAIACKFGGTVLAARVTGVGWRDSSILGALMNTRGLTELIVLNLALEKGVMTEALFAALVLMALVTTFMTGPLLRLIDPSNVHGTPVEAEFEAARGEAVEAAPVPVPTRSILVTAEQDASIDQLLALAEPLAASAPPRELIIARLVRPPRQAAVRGGLQTEQLRLDEAQGAVEEARRTLLAHGVAARAVAFTSADAGRDLTRLATKEPVDLVLLAGRRPLLGGGVPRGEVGEVLGDAPCDVGVLVARSEDRIEIGPQAPVIVPFGGAEHDWAALELGAWIAAASGSPLRLLGAAGEDGEGGDASRLLANASLLVQQLTGVAAEALIAPRGRAGVIASAAGAGLLVIGLSDRWRQEGLGATRADIARAAPAPIVFVRRGARAGALASRADMTRFTWSTAGVVAGDDPSAQPGGSPGA